MIRPAPGIVTQGCMPQGVRITPGVALWSPSVVVITDDAVSSNWMISGSSGSVTQMFAPVSKRKGSFSLLAFSLTALTEMDCDVQHLIGIDVYPFFMESISWIAVSMHLESILIDAVCL